MRIFARLYDQMLLASRHRHAPWFLSAIAASEAAFFPLPPDIMLAPMALARPQAWIQLASLTTAASVIGGIGGYLIGHYLLDVALPIITQWGYLDAYHTAVSWFERYGFWAIFAAGFTPIPYKVFTISAGAAQMAFLPFVFGSIIGRGGRFFLVAGLVRALGPSGEERLRRYIDAIGWATLVILCVGLWVWKG